MEDRRRIVSRLVLQLDFDARDRKPTLLTQDLFDTVLDKDRKLFIQTAVYGIAGSEDRDGLKNSPGLTGLRR